MKLVGGLGQIKGRGSLHILWNSCNVMTTSLNAFKRLLDTFMEDRRSK